MLTSSAQSGSVPHERPFAGAQLAVAAIVALGFALRVACARGDLWIDEVWSLTLVSGLGSALDVFWKVSHDNNHFLNSFWIAVLDPDNPAIAYRLPSIVFGTLSPLIPLK